MDSDIEMPDYESDLKTQFFGSDDDLFEMDFFDIHGVYDYDLSMDSAMIIDEEVKPFVR